MASVSALNLLLSPFLLHAMSLALRDTPGQSPSLRVLISMFSYLPLTVRHSSMVTVAQEQKARSPRAQRSLSRTRSNRISILRSADALRWLHCKTSVSSDARFLPCQSQESMFDFIALFRGAKWAIHALAWIADCVTLPRGVR